MDLDIFVSFVDFKFELIKTVKNYSETVTLLKNWSWKSSVPRSRFFPTRGRSIFNFLFKTIGTLVWENYEVFISLVTKKRKIRILPVDYLRSFLMNNPQSVGVPRNCKLLRSKEEMAIIHKNQKLNELWRFTKDWRKW